MREVSVATGGSMSLALVRPIAKPSDLIELHKDVAKLIAEGLEEGVDYGVVPGTGGKPSLLKPGAERLTLAFGAHPEYVTIDSEVDHNRIIAYTKRKKRYLNRHKGDREWEWEETPGESRGIYRYIYECKLVRHDGRVLGTGQGVCSTMESKYVDRPRDCENTVLKMAQKRAFVAAVLNAFGLSNRFTQDVEDMERDEPAPRPFDDAVGKSAHVPNELEPQYEEPAPAPQSAVATKRQPAVYSRHGSQEKDLQAILQKRDVPSEIWGDIEQELLGKPFTALSTIVPAARARFEAHIEAQRAATAAAPEEPAADAPAEAAADP